MDDIQEELFDDLRKEYAKDKRVTEAMLTTLHSVFRSSLKSALDIIDRHGVTRVQSPSGRTLFQVVGGSGTTYTCLSAGRYCTCPAFLYKVLRKEEHILCKHVLAARLAQALDSCARTESVLDEQMSDLLENLC